MSKLKTPFRYDFVGSFLRPQALKNAKIKFENNEITKEEYDGIVNNEITKLVAKQKELGYHAITDGEFRRTFWHLDFMWGFNGVEHKATGGGVPFNGELAVLDDTYLVGKFKAKAHQFVEYFKFLKQFEDENTVAKYTIPAPAQTYLQLTVPGNIEQTRKFYATDDELINDIASAYQNVIAQFYEAGCRNLHIEITIDPKDLRIDTYRASGAGGQHINKTDSAVRITHIPTNTVVSCQSQRSQLQNREQAMLMLKSKLYLLMQEAHAEKLSEIQGEKKNIEWGSQIRSYVLHPYSMVKDNRSGYESNDPKKILDGELDDLIYAYLRSQVKEKNNE